MKILDTGKATAEENMSIDAQLLQDLDPNGEAILHLYDWELPSATYGHFIDPNQFFTPVATKKIDLAKRPTGGGVIFHTCDFAFSFLIPAWHPKCSQKTLDNYALVNRAVIQAIDIWMGGGDALELLSSGFERSKETIARFCMARPTKYDVVFRGRKVGGAAQRRTKRGLLHQGTIALGLPDSKLLREVLLEGEFVAGEMHKHSDSLLEENWDERALFAGREKMKQVIKRALNSEF